MGAKPISNKIKGLMYKTKSAYSQIGQISYCPNCSQEFPPTTLYETFDQHVTLCLDTYNPSDQERIRKQRKNSRKSSKDSIDSNGQQIEENEQIIQVYHREWSTEISHESLQTIKRKSIVSKFKFSYNPQTLFKLSYSHVSLMKTPVKILYIHHRFNEFKISWKHGSEQLLFNPNNIMADSLQILKLNMFKELKLVVTGDKVKDAGGLLRQWARMVIKNLGQTGLFLETKKSNDYLLINKRIPENLINIIPKLEDAYHMFGVLLGKILLQKVNIPFRFNYPFLRILLGQQENIQVKDFITFDTNIYSSLKYLEDLYFKIQKNESMLNKDLSQNQQTDILEKIGQYYQQLRSLQLTFSIITQGQQQYELLQNGRKMFVHTAQQLRQYLYLVMKFYAYGYSHNNQYVPVSMIKDGFFTIMDKFDLGTILQPQQLQIMLNGLQSVQILVQDWKAGTQYKEPYNNNHKVIKQFWKYIEKLDGKEKAKVLKFVTGSQNLPIFGFKYLQTNRGQTSCFSIQPMKYDKKKAQFPKAHTCFNRLILPIYPNQEALIHGLDSIVKNQFDGVWGIQ